jgi:hypothetical protein
MEGFCFHCRSKKEMKEGKYITSSECKLLS